VYWNDEKICHGYWWRHCTRKPKVPVWMMKQCAIQPGSVWKHLNNSSKRTNFHLSTKLCL
jgi:hypothetical protein